MSNPCFNKETHTDCPKRHSGCAIDCPDWAAYCAERDKEYEKRAEVCEKNSLISKSLDNRIAKKMRRVIEDRTYGFAK